jgi:hypothetical protein
MDTDTASASERLERELRPTPRRRLVTAAAVVAAAAVVVAALLTWSDREGRNATPIDQPGTPSPSSDTSDAGTRPSYFLDIGTLDQTRAPGPLARIARNSVVLTFSLDGTQVAFASCKASDYCSSNDRAFFGNADGTGLQRVEFGADRNAYPLSWTPDGRLVVQARHGGTPDVGDLFLYDPRTSNSTRITSVGLEAAPWYAMNAFVSVDGTRVYYSRARNEDYYSPIDAWSVSVSGGASTPLFRDLGDVREVVDDLADGRVAFRRPPSEVMAATPGEDPHTMIESADEFLVSPDGTHIAYLDGDLSDDLFVLDVATGETGDPVAANVTGFWWAGSDRLLIQ